MRRGYGYMFECWGHKAAYSLAFDDCLRGKLPPGGMNGEWFDAEMLDLITGKSHVVKHDYIAIEPVEWFDEALLDFIDAFALHNYMYAAHWCGCHRITSLEVAGVDIDVPDEFRDEENYCPSDRFIVTKLWHRSMPELVLFYEEEIGE